MSGLNGVNAVTHVVLMQYGQELEHVVSIVEKMIFKNALIILTWYSPENSSQFVFVLLAPAVIVPAVLKAK